MEKAKPHTINLTDDEYELIKAMREVSEDDASYKKSICYIDPMLPTQTGLQAKDLIRAVSQSKDKSSLYLEIALRNTLERGLLQDFATIAPSVNHFGMNFTTDNTNRFYREIFYSLDIEQTIKEFKMYLFKVYGEQEIFKKNNEYDR